jgi:uncharacterized protein (DUF2141 family)
MRKLALLFVLFAIVPLASRADSPASCTLTIVVDGMSSSQGVLGIVIFNQPRGWPEDVSSSYLHTAFRAKSGTQTIKIPNLPPGKYALALIHDLNENMRLDKNWVGKPKEQWGMSNNPRATFRPPSFDRAVFNLNADLQITVKLQ